MRRPPVRSCEDGPPLYLREGKASSPLAGKRNARLERMALDLERAHLTEYIQYLKRPGVMIRTNLVAGLARGFGMAVGFTILGAAVVYFLRQLAYRNLPVIGGFIAEIVRIVTLQQGSR